MGNHDHAVVRLRNAEARASGQPSTEPADLVYRPGRIYTVDADRPGAEAVAIAAGRFVLGLY